MKKETEVFENAAEQKVEQAFEVINARELQNMDIPPMQYRVEGLIANGLSIVAAPPKYGKSWMMLVLGGCVANGSPFLGFPVNQCECLYLALEDSMVRLKERLNMIYPDGDAPEGLHLVTKWSTMDDGMLEHMEKFLESHQKVGLIIVDTLQKVRGLSFGREGTYGTDYRELSIMKAFADSHKIALLVVHHLRKMGDDSDPFNRISGSVGIIGVADTAIVLTREHRNSDETTMSVVGRDVEGKDLSLTLDKKSGVWVCHGEKDNLLRQEYESSPIVKTIRKLVDDNAGRWTGFASDILREGETAGIIGMPNTPRAVASEIMRYEKKLYQMDGIVHSRNDNGSGGGKHIFYRVERSDDDVDSLLQ